jgi:phosphoglycolate phosphatase-like HAD superfamily hydrolase
MRMLVLDFDGVISDSAPEAFVVALRTYVRLRPESALRRDADALAAPDAPALGAVRAARLYAPFVEHMPLGNRAEDYAVVLSALEHARPLPDQAAYDVLRSAEDPGWLRAYHERFYRERSALRARDPEGWAGLLAPYASLLAVLRRRAHHARLAIATAKDRDSVHDLLARYGIADLFPADCVLDKETGVSKRAHLEALRTRSGLSYAEITFVDDKVNHLEPVAALGVRCALAAWGYNGLREQREARRQGHLVCTLGDVEEKLYG